MKVIKIAGTTIEPPGYTSLYKGDYWGPWKRCRRGTRVKGMKLRIEENQRTGDDTALNAIRLTCTDGKVLKSKEGGWGSWQSYIQSDENRYKYKYNRITSVKLRSEPRMRDTWYRSADNTAANGIRFRDGNGKNYNPGDGNWGDWGSWASCPTGSYIVGFRTYVVPHRGSGDDTALERVQFKCGKTTS